jgi:NADPH2:quinone reductase
MHSQMLALGASSCIDYTLEDPGERAIQLAGGPVDAIADLVGGQQLAAALGSVRPGGQVAAIATPQLDLDPLLDANITFHGVLIQDDGERTRRLAALLANRALQPVISRELPLAEAAEAHRILERRHASGKIILNIVG